MKVLAVNADGEQFQCENIDILPERLEAAKNFGSPTLKRDIPVCTGVNMEGQMNLDDPVSRRRCPREVSVGYSALKDGSISRVVVFSI